MDRLSLFSSEFSSTFSIVSLCFFTLFKITENDVYGGGGDLSSAPKILLVGSVSAKIPIFFEKG